MNDQFPPETDSDDLALRRALRGFGGTPPQAPAVLEGLRPTMRRARRRHQAVVLARTGALGALVLFGAAAVTRSLGDDHASETDVVSPDLPDGTEAPPPDVDIGEGVSVDAPPVEPSTPTSTMPASSTSTTSAASTEPGASTGSGSPSATTPTGSRPVPPSGASTTAPTVSIPVAPPPTVSGPPDDGGPADESSDDDDNSDDSESDDDDSGSGSGNSGTGSGGSATTAAPPQTQAVTSACGSATFSWTANQLSLVSTAPGPGFPAAEIDVRSATEISVTFGIDDDAECQIEARLEGGALVPRVDNG